MRRRRLPGRPIRRIIRGGGSPGHPVPPKLREAHRLYEAGNYAQAAVLYAEVAERADFRAIPQAANLYLCSGIAYLKINKFDQAEKMIKKGLGVSIQHKSWPQLERNTAMVVGELERAGQVDLAAAIKKWVDAQIPPEIKENIFRQTDSKHEKQSTLKLPANCPNCGGPVHPKEVEWFDAENPICAFCGSILRND